MRNQRAAVVLFDPKFTDEEIADTMNIMYRLKGVKIVEPIMYRDNMMFENGLMRLEFRRDLDIYIRNYNFEKLRAKVKKKS